MRQTEKQSLVRRIFSTAILAALLTMMPRSFSQHLSGGHPGGFGGGHLGGFSGGHLGAFNGGGFHGGFSAPSYFGRFPGQVPRGFGAVPRKNWTASRYNFVPRQNSYASYRSPNGAGNRGGWTRPGRDHNLRYRRPYTGSGYGSYPYLYSNSWELLPWDIGYPDYTGYDEDYESTQSNNGQVQPSGEEQQQQQPKSEGYRPEYVPAPYESSANRTAPSPPPRNEPQLTLIFKDGHTQTIRNYVLTPSEVIVMDDASSGRIPRISLSELNLPATEKAANQAGLDFSPPSA